MRLPLRPVAPGGQRLAEREIVNTVDLCLPSGILNPESVGWTRHALHRTWLPGWGRNKRFEYWAVTTPDAIVTMNISHHDYRANVSVGFTERDGYREIRQGGNTWLPGPGGMRDPFNHGPMEARRKDVLVRLTPRGTGMHLYAESPRIQADIRVLAHPGHESMGVVVPWSPRRFQYTKKDNCLSAEGIVVVDGVTHPVEALSSSAVHDRGRGRWPYFTFWNWGAGVGRTSDGRDLGIQLGGKWTDGTPSSENWVRIDGRLHKIENHLDWRYDPTNWTAPWTITGPDVEIVFTPEHHTQHLFDRWLVYSRGDTCFGRYDGRVVVAGTEVTFSGVFGHVEEVERRW
ncbi:DUF2804 domain-containing protein [Leifsonia sp. 21MFCrub1.1]|uniref:DUF2804 domain-containing protein n=1 Tax=Leifsonia sp. 21MFCrub1.1 TaxID=1798223 RepID=UPI0008929899|nr:DUF2804 domain-containing protein [Leifsonia sp. 21MFCrub1.1]SEB07922.1 Protein of unknown function [Leifsonia sp. 21MFCrub1.1]